MERANRCTVQANKEGYVARFWRTHKELKTVTDTQAQTQGYTPDANLNSTAQRELYRAWVCKNAGLFGVEYDPEDRRTAQNMFPSKYDSDAVLNMWAVKIVGEDIQEWIGKIRGEYKVPMTITGIEADEIVPMVARKGKPVQAKYGNGNWAYATIPVVATVEIADKESKPQYGYVTMNVELVSGQLKKPSHIGENGYTFTGFKTELLKDIEQYLPKTEKESKTESKDEKKTGKNK